MCNPPFYASTSDLLASAAAKSRPPHSACTGAEVEMVTPGGEIAFASRMIDKSSILKNRCQWYTSMLGKYSSVEVVVENLRAAGVVNWAVKDLVQGNKTRRWAVAWSWGNMRPSQVRITLALIARHSWLTQEVKGGCERYFYITQALAPIPVRERLSHLQYRQGLLRQETQRDTARSRPEMEISARSRDWCRFHSWQCLVPGSSTKPTAPKPRVGPERGQRP